MLNHQYILTTYPTIFPEDANGAYVVSAALEPPNIYVDFGLADGMTNNIPDFLYPDTATVPRPTDFSKASVTYTSYPTTTDGTVSLTFSFTFVDGTTLSGSLNTSSSSGAGGCSTPMDR